EVFDVAGGLPVTQAATVLAQVEGVKTGTAACPELSELALKEVVRPAVHVEHPRSLEQTFPVKHFCAPAALGRARTHESCYERPLTIAAKVEVSALKPCTQNIFAPHGHVASLLGELSPKKYCAEDIRSPKRSSLSGG